MTTTVYITRPFSSHSFGDVITVDKDRAARLVRYGYAEYASAADADGIKQGDVANLGAGSTVDGKTFVTTPNPQVPIDGDNQSLDLRPSVDRTSLRVFKWNPPNADPGWQTGLLIGSQGSLHTNAWVVISGNHNAVNPEGVAYPRGASANANMLSIWADVNLGMEVKVAPGATARAIDIVGGTSDPATADVRMSIGTAGELTWGPVGATYATRDTSLSRTGAGVLSMTGSGSDPQFLTKWLRATDQSTSIVLNTSSGGVTMTGVGAGSIGLAVNKASGGTLPILKLTENNDDRFSVLPSGLIQFIAANEQTTVGAAGGASAPPASPTKYLKVVDSTGATLVVPAYASA